jgi:ribosome-associated protein
MENIRLIKEQLENVKAVDISVFNFKGQSPFYDYFIVATTNDRQANAAINYIKKVLPKEQIKHVEGKGGSWLLIDCFEIIVHLFREEDRAFYNFDERLMEFKVHDL